MCEKVKWQAQHDLNSVNYAVRLNFNNQRGEFGDSFLYCQADKSHEMSSLI